MHRMDRGQGIEKSVWQYQVQKPNLGFDHELWQWREEWRPNARVQFSLALFQKSNTN